MDALSLTRDVQSGLITGLNLNNVHESSSYSLFAELSAKQVLFNSGAIFNESFIRDGLGRITQKTETISGVTSVYQYSYDVSGRLTDVVKDGVNVGHYAYDLNSNRTSATIRGSNITATYDSQDRVVSYNGVSYTFNGHGDLQSKSDGSDYAYDIFGGTTSVTKGGNTITYLNDAEGHRVVRYKNGLPWGAFIYNEIGQLVGEFDSSGAIRASFHYASQSHSPDLMLKGSAKYYFVKDHLGSVRLVVNSSTGAIDQRIDYDEFGQVLADSNPGFQPFGFAGGLYDPDTKLVQFGARSYDPETGRWTSKDPSRFKGATPNLYQYCNSEPINHIDTDGEFAFALTGAAAFADAVAAIAFDVAVATGTVTIGNQIADWAFEVYNKITEDRKQLDKDAKEAKERGDNGEPISEDEVEPTRRQNRQIFGQKNPIPDHSGNLCPGI